MVPRIRVRVRVRVMVRVRVTWSLGLVNAAILVAVGCSSNIKH